MLPGLEIRIPLCEVMDGSHVERIDGASMDILENVGVQFRDPVAPGEWEQAGAKVIGERVYPDRGLVRELIAGIPSEFTYRARNPANNVKLGGRHAVFVPMTGAPYLRDLEGRAPQSHAGRPRDVPTSSATCCLHCTAPRTTSWSPTIIRSASATCASRTRP